MPPHRIKSATVDHNKTVIAMNGSSQVSAGGVPVNSRSRKWILLRSCIMPRRKKQQGRKIKLCQSPWHLYNRAFTPKSPVLCFLSHIKCNRNYFWIAYFRMEMFAYHFGRKSRIWFQDQIKSKSRAFYLFIFNEGGIKYWTLSLVVLPQLLAPVPAGWFVEAGN